MDSWSGGEEWRGESWREGRGDGRGEDHLQWSEEKEPLQVHNVVYDDDDDDDNDDVENDDDI